jgi:phosphoglycerate dehydrogenase-like enzyme
MEILLPEGTYRRVAREFERIAPAASFVLVRDDGILLRDGREVESADLQIEVAWASRDLYVLEEPVAIREFMIAILKSENVRWMHSGGAGTDHPIFASISKKGVRLTNSDSGAIAIAEYVLAGVLDFYQPGSPRRSLQLAGQWQSTPFREICETTWLVIGLGNIGREVALRARAFGAQVIGVRRTPTGDEPVAELISPDEVAAHLPRADVIVLCAAFNASTRHLVDAQFLSALRPEALLVNIARGGMIDEAALLESLDRGRPERALLDVFETEPLPAESPFWNHPRVRMTAHCAAGGSGTNARSDRGFLENLARYVRGEALQMELHPGDFL